MQGAIGANMAGMQLREGDGDDSGSGKGEWARGGGDMSDLDALMQRNRDKLGRLRRSNLFP